MSTVTKEVQLAEQVYEAVHGLATFGAVVKTQLADGWSMADDLPVLLTAALSKLVPAIEGLDQFDDEFSEDPVAVLQAVVEGFKPFLAALKPQA